LQPPEEPGVAIRRIPKLPRDHAGTVPVRVHIRAAVPQIDVPTQAVDQLATHTAVSPTFCVCAFAIGCGWGSICDRQAILASAVELPGPTARCAAPNRKRTSQSISADGMGAPIRIYGKPRRRRHKRAGECPGQNRRWKNAWQCLVETRERLTISFGPLGLPFGHLGLPTSDSMVPQSRKAFVTAAADGHAISSNFRTRLARTRRSPRLSAP
jgi:hypothetical protein